MEMPDIGSYLASLDYRNYVSHRDGLPSTDEYERIQSIFAEATGKEIKLPTYDPETTKSSIDVELPSGAKHPLSELSNGERELLGMLYYVSQLNAQGGVLLLDEPEKHLHPTLQLAALRAMSAIADRGQLLVVTHSPGIISSSPADQVLVVQPAWNAVSNQLQRVSDLENQTDLLADLGLTSRDLLQTNYLLVVEGPDDEKRLRMLLPNELAGAKVITAGGVDAVLGMASSLRGLDIGVPWLCVVDRDFMSADEVAEVTKKGDVFVWDARMLENVLLASDVLPEVLTLNGTSIEVARASIRAAIDRGREASLTQFVSARVDRAMPDQKTPSTKPQGERTLVNLVLQRDLWNYRIENFDRIRAEVSEEFTSSWESRWADFVDGKRIFADIQRSTQIFRNASTLIDSLMVRMRDNSDRLPQTIRDLKDRLSRLSRTQQTIVAVPAIGDPEQSYAAPLEPAPSLNAGAHEMYYQGGC